VKKRRALVWVLVAVVALAAFATVAALLPPPREPIEDDLAALAKKYGMVRSADLEPFFCTPHFETVPSDRYEHHGLTPDQFGSFRFRLRVLLESRTTAVSVERRYVSPGGSEDTTVLRGEYDGGTILVEIARNGDRASLAYRAKPDRALTQRVREWWRGVRGGP
jgi:hypothetical protein